MNSDIIVKVLKTQYSSSTGLAILKLLVPTLTIPLTGDNVIDLLRLSCFSSSGDKNIVIDLLIENNVAIDAIMLDKIMELMSYDKKTTLLKLCKYKDSSVTFEFIKKYIDRSIDSVTLLALIDMFKGDTVDLYELLDLVRGSSVNDETRCTLIQNYVKDQPDPEKLSNYFGNYELFEKTCEDKGIDHANYSQYENKINEENKIIVVFGVYHSIDSFNINEPFVLYGTSDNGIGGIKNDIKLTVTRKSNDNVQIEYESKTNCSFHSSNSTVTIKRGLVIDVDGFFYPYK